MTRGALPQGVWVNSTYTLHIRDTTANLQGVLKKKVQLHPNDLKSGEFDKEAPQNFYPERATIAERQGASEDENFGAKLTLSKT